MPTHARGHDREIIIVVIVWITCGMPFEALRRVSKRGATRPGAVFRPGEPIGGRPLETAGGQRVVTAILSGSLIRA